jgi:ribosomal protein L37AE/L43A
MEELKCPKCKKKNIRFRIKLKEYICNICGYSWKKEEVDNGSS